MRFYREKQEPQDGEIKYTTYFAWFPAWYRTEYFINGSTKRTLDIRWLQYVTVKKRYHPNLGHGAWLMKGFIEEGEKI